MRITGEVTEDTDATLLGYAVHGRNVPIAQSDVASITYTVTDLQAGTPVSGHDNVTLTAAAVIIDTPLTAGDDSRWDQQGGYNFSHDVAGTAWPIGGRVYSYEAIIVLTDGVKVPVLFDLNCQRIDRS